MIYTYHKAGKLTDEIGKLITEVVENFDVCKKNGKSKSKSSVDRYLSLVLSYVVTLYLKDMGRKFILCMVCSFTKYMKGVVLNDKTSDALLKSPYCSWYIIWI